MVFALPGVRIGPHAGCSGLTVFPLFAVSPGGRVSYLLGDEAIEEGLVTVEEVGESGSVPNLLVRNLSDSRVLFLEGEEFRCDSPSGDQGVALVLEGVMVHGSLVAQE